MAEDIIEKLKTAKLVGRSGCCFPTWQKWQAVRNAPGERKYVICNASEGEPQVEKDYYILKNYTSEVINGIMTALDYTSAQTAYLYLNENYYQEFKNALLSEINDKPIQLFKKPHGYLKGEETAILEAIEGKFPEPRIKPPFPTEKGLFGYPTLINNLETFYCVSQIAKNQYKNTRFYTISGEVVNKGVFELPESTNIKTILQETGNFPNFPFFVKAGGGAVGEFLVPNELDKPIQGIASLVIYNKDKTSILPLLTDLAKFFMQENCDKCAPCREGIFRIYEHLKGLDNNKRKLNKALLQDLIFNLETSSLCPLGRSAATPFKTALEKLI